MGENMTREKIVLVAFGFLMGTTITAILVMWALTLKAVELGLGRPI